MDLSQLETFVAVVEERGFSRAAHRLHRTQPAVSQSVRRLEEELGERLFERYARDGTLTAAGEVLLDYARRMLALRGEAHAAVDELRALARGRLTVAANEYTSHFLLRVLPVYRQSCPQISVFVQRSLASRIADEVEQRQVELGVLTFQPEGLESVCVWEDEVVFVVDRAHPMARRQEVRVRELGAQNFVGHSVASPLRRQIFELFEAHRTPLHTGVQLPSLEAIKRFVQRGGGVAILPGLAVAEELERGELVRVHVPELEASRRRLWLVYRRGATLSHAAQALMGVLETEAGTRGAPALFVRGSHLPAEEKV
jgi:DNA-binding transcriptional LysR family regulator